MEKSLNQNLITRRPTETHNLGKQIGKFILMSKFDYGVFPICLFGDLGSGKTTFVQGFAQTIGISDRLLSPTFIIIRRYDISGRWLYLYHIDLYRLNAKMDLASIGIQEILQSKNGIILIEWAEKLGSLLPEKRIDCKFKVNESGDHEINIIDLTH
jgi:tRNA threonylcarbamoyladenosine biosynthesis protein TsaE